MCILSTRRGWAFRTPRYLVNPRFVQIIFEHPLRVGCKVQLYEYPLARHAFLQAFSFAFWRHSFLQAYSFAFCRHSGILKAFSFGARSKKWNSTAEDNAPSRDKKHRQAFLSLRLAKKTAAMTNYRCEQRDRENWWRGVWSGDWVSVNNTAADASCDDHPRNSSHYGS